MPKHVTPKPSQTKIFKDLMLDGWEIISSKRGKLNIFEVTLKKVFKRGKGVIDVYKQIFVGWWALPKTVKVKDSKEAYKKMRGGTPKAARMAYA